MSFVEVAPGFYNLRTGFNVFIGMVDIGNHMSLAKLESGKFMVIDTADLCASAKRSFDEITENGSLVECVVATHPFHTMFFEPFQKLYPDIKNYYGAPRHLKKIKCISWAGDISEEVVRNQWSSQGIEMRIPDGADFCTPAEDNHFSSVFVLHKASKTVHVDDTIMFFSHPGFLLRMVGATDGKMGFHPSTLKNGLYPTESAPNDFKVWLENVIKDWDFENICAAHTGNKIGNAKPALVKALNDIAPKLEKLSLANKAKA